ncbi:DUF2938 domain-containing protein [Pluralibacter gergoviae]
MNSCAIITSLTAGAVATLIMDLWSLFQRQILGIPPLDYRLVGRWLSGICRGRFLHRTIISTPPVPGERLIGWLAHYFTGLLFAFIPGGLAGEVWYSQPTLIPALAAGLLTLAFPLLVMQPAFGFGIAASRVPQPGRARLMSVLAHAVYGAGLYVAATSITALCQ